MSDVASAWEQAAVLTRKGDPTQSLVQGIGNSNQLIRRVERNTITIKSLTLSKVKSDNDDRVLC